MSSLHLDPVFEFSHVVEGYGYKDVEKQASLDGGETRKINYQRNGVSFFREELWCRVTILGQSIILLLVNIGKQSVRLTACFLSGAMRTDGGLLWVAVKDAFSLPVNCVALPILGVIATVSPTLAAFVAKRIEKWLNKDSFQSPGIWQISQYYHVSKTTGLVVMRATAPIQLVLATVQKILTECLNPCVFNDTAKVAQAPLHLIKHTFSVLLTDEYHNAHGLLPR